MPEVRLAIQEAKPAFGKWDYAMEGRRMFALDSSPVATQLCHSQRIAPLDARGLRLGLTTMLTALLAISSASGCRTPWRSSTAEPSFDRLIEIEQRSSHQRPVGREPQASRLRPGPAKYAMHPNGPGAVPPAAAAAGSPVPSGGSSMSARRSLSDHATHGHSQNLAHDQDFDDLDEMLVDVPPAQRDLLRREMSTMRRAAQGPTDAQHKATSDPQLAANETSQRSSAAPDRPVDPNDYVGPSKYQLAAKESSRQAGPEDEPSNAGSQVYSRKFSDRDDASATTLKPSDKASTERASTETVVSKTPAAATAADGVVTASYAADSQAAATPTATTASTANAAQSEPLDWRQHINAALAQLEDPSTAASPEEQIHLQMVQRMLHMSLGDIEAASEPIDGLQANGQDFIRHSLKSLHDVTNPSGNPVETKRYTLAMISQRQAMNHLASVSNLEVRNATFCTEVDGFGVVTKFPQYAFKPDQELLLYCELDNFVSTQLEGKGYETQLQGSYEIVDANGRRVADQLLPLDSHLCRNQRRDYFIAYRIYMPQKIDAGKYQLKLTIEDMKGRKFGQSVLDFQIQ